MVSTDEAQLPHSPKDVGENDNVKSGELSRGSQEKCKKGDICQRRWKSVCARKGGGVINHVAKP